MQSPTSIKQLIQQIMPRQTEIVIGKVMSANPLKVQVINDEKLVLNRNILIIPKRIVDEPLKFGECIHILVVNSGKKYYALDRAVM